MKPGNSICQITILFFLLFNFSYGDEKITTTPLINIEKIKPSFEELVDDNENISLDQNLKKKKNKRFKTITSNFNWA